MTSSFRFSTWQCLLTTMLYWLKCSGPERNNIWITKYNVNFVANPAWPVLWQWFRPKGTSFDHSLNNLRSRPLNKAYQSMLYPNLIETPKGLSTLSKHKQLLHCTKCNHVTKAIITILYPCPSLPQFNTSNCSIRVDKQKRISPKQSLLGDPLTHGFVNY